MEDPAEETDSEKDGDGVAAGNAFGNHETEENAVRLLAVMADGVEKIVNQSGGDGAVFEDGEHDGEPGDGIEIRDEPGGDGEAVELVRLDDFPKT